VKYGIEELEYDSDTKRFIEMRFVQRIIDIDQGIDDEIPFPAKICGKEEFSRTPSTQEIFERNELKGLITYCPDVEAYKKMYGKELHLDGNRASH
jgi:hypothetical protein